MDVFPTLYAMQNLTLWYEVSVSEWSLFVLGCVVGKCRFAVQTEQRDVHRKQLSQGTNRWLEQMQQSTVSSDTVERPARWKRCVSKLLWVTHALPLKTSRSYCRRIFSNSLRKWNSGRFQYKHTFSVSLILTRMLFPVTTELALEL